MARRVSRLAALAVLAGVAASSPAWGAGADCLKLPPGKIAFQLYAVSDVVVGSSGSLAAGQPSEAPVTASHTVENLLASMHAMGWRKFENFAAGLGLPADEFARLVQESGLRVISSHDSLDMAGWSAVLDRAKALGQTYVGSGGVGRPGIGTLEDTLQSAANLEQLGEAAAKSGLKFFVHTHQLEIRTRYDVDLKGDGRKQSRRVIDILASKTNPRFVNFEIDIGWAAAAFDLDQDATADFLRRHRSRIVLVHVKDMAANAKPTDLGVGMLDYAKLLKAAGSHVAYYIWEYDHPPMPLQSAALAYRYMTCGPEGHREIGESHK